MAETLMDAVTTLAPRGSDDMCPSTYWIDVALRATSDEQERHTGKASLSGNATGLLLVDDEIIARSDYELFLDQRVRVDEFVRVLRLGVTR